MTSLTAEQLIPRPASRSARRTVAGFVAGVLLTAAAAVGVNAAVGGSGNAAHSFHHSSAPEPGCFVLGGAC